MKQIKIFPKDWLQLHPYKQSTPVDSYYTTIANRIYDILVQTELINSFEGDEAKQLCIRMAAISKMSSPNWVFGGPTSRRQRSCTASTSPSIRPMITTMMTRPIWRMSVSCCGISHSNTMAIGRVPLSVRIIRPTNGQPV